MEFNKWIADNNCLRKELFAEQQKNRELANQLAQLANENHRLRELLEEVAADTAEHTSIVLRKVRQPLKGGDTG